MTSFCLLGPSSSSSSSFLCWPKIRVIIVIGLLLFSKFEAWEPGRGRHYFYHRGRLHPCEGGGEVLVRPDENKEINGKKKVKGWKDADS